jgi:hypothetical protein
MLPLPETPTLLEPIQYRKPLGGLTGCPGPSWVEEGRGTGKQVVKSYPPMSIVRRKSECVDYSQV